VVSLNSTKSYLRAVGIFVFSEKKRRDRVLEERDRESCSHTHPLPKKTCHARFTFFKLKRNNTKDTVFAESRPNPNMSCSGETFGQHKTIPQSCGHFGILRTKKSDRGRK
jgi:hypothetical protein